MPRHRGVARVRQAELLEPAAPAHQLRVPGDLGEEPVEQHRVELGAGDLVAQRAADQLGAAALYDDRRRRGHIIAETQLIGVSVDQMSALDNQ